MMEEDGNTSHRHDRAESCAEVESESLAQPPPPPEPVDEGKDDTAPSHPRRKMFKVTSSNSTGLTLQSSQSLCTLNNAFREAESAVPGFMELELIGNYFTLPYRSGLHIENLKILCIRGKKGNIFSLLRSLANACPMLTYLELDFPDEELVDVEESPSSTCETLRVFKLTVDQLEDFTALMNAIAVMYTNLRELNVNVTDEYECDEDEDIANVCQGALNLDVLEFSAKDMNPDDRLYLERVVLAYCPYLTAVKARDDVYLFRRSKRFSGYFGHLGGNLSITHNSVNLSIPPGALDESSSEKIIIETFSELPRGTCLQDNEVVACLGFRCFPSGLTFKKPLTLTMPHCAILSDLQKINMILHFGNDNGGTHDINRIHLKTNEYVIHDDRIELSLGHFSWGITTLIYNWIHSGDQASEMHVEKRMLCTPFLPTTFPRDIGCPILHLCIYNQVTGLAEDIAKEENLLGYKKAYPEQEWVVNTGSADMSITCETVQSQDSPSATNETVSTSDLMQHSKLTVPITVPNLKSMVTLIISQERKITMKFPADIKDGNVETMPANFQSLSIADVPLNPEAGATPSDGALFQKTPRHSGCLTDDQLEKISRELPLYMFNTISVKLNFSATETENMRSSSNNPCFTMLTRWQERTGADKAKLVDVLKNVKLYGIIQSLGLETDTSLEDVD